MQKQMQLYSENEQISSQNDKNSFNNKHQELIYSDFPQNISQSQQNQSENRRNKRQIEENKQQMKRKNSNPQINYVTKADLHSDQHIFNQKDRLKVQKIDPKVIDQEIKIKNLNHNKIYDKNLINQLDQFKYKTNNEQKIIKEDIIAQKIEYKPMNNVNHNNIGSIQYIEIQQQQYDDDEKEVKKIKKQKLPQQIWQEEKVLQLQNIHKVIKNGYSPYLFKRNQQCGLNFCRPDFFLGTLNEKMLICSKKQPLSLFYSEYKIYLCQNQQQIIKDKSLLLGKIIGNFFGTQFNIYKYTMHKQMELCATIVYKTQCKCTSFKDISIFIPNQQKERRKDDEQFLRLYGKVQNFKDLYFNRYTPDGYIHRLITKVPVWREHLQKFTLNFKRKAKMPSTKNIILVNESKPSQNSFLFCKQSQQRFYCQISYPLSPFMGMGLILSMFDFKLSSQ